MEVFNDAEIDRILALPRRPPLTPDEANQAADLLTRSLAMPGSTRKFFPIQAQALTDIVQYRKLFGALAPGSGKSDLTCVIPVLLKAKRSLLMVPANLREKTLEVVHKSREHWRDVPQPLDLTDRAEPGKPALRVISYEALSQVGNAAFLEEYDPDLIMLDEAHALADPKTGRGRRFYRYVRNKRRRGQPLTVIPLTGTAWARRLRRTAYLLEAALGDGSPLPGEYNALLQWAMALDQGVKDHDRLEPGALYRFCTPEQRIRGRAGVLEALQDWVRHTPGYVASREASCDIPLIMQRRHITPPASVLTAMSNLRDLYLLPSGDSAEAGVTFWNQTQQVANGFAYYYDPPPPDEWRKAKSAWSNFVREAMRSNQTLDTPLQVWQAVESGQFGEVHEHRAWVAVRDTFKPVPKPWWLSDYVVRDAEQWAIKNKGIVWVRHSTAHTDEPDDDAVGGCFKEIPYFGAGDERIRTYRGPCAASVRAHGTGKDLVQWNEALLMGFPSSGLTIEQLVARHHREGQKADTVRIHFYAHSLENLNAVEQCIEDARHVQTLTGADQRILTADWLDADGKIWNAEEYRAAQDGPMWAATEDETED